MNVLQRCLDSISYHAKELSHGTHSSSSHGDVLDIHCSLEILHCYGNRIDHMPHEPDDDKTNDQLLNELFVECLNVIYSFSNKTLTTLALLCITKLLRHGSSDLTNRLKAVSEMLQRIWLDDNKGDKPLMVLCGLANHFFPTNGQCKGQDLRIDASSVNFWTIVQCGIHSKNPLTRKQAMYLVKRITDICQTLSYDVGDYSQGLFWWKSNQADQQGKVWEDFILLVETLEEKQVLHMHNTFYFWTI